MPSFLPIIVFWFRRDLRIFDNVGLTAALAEAKKQNGRVLPLFIFDTDILIFLPPDDHRVYFIYQTLKNLDNQFKKQGSSLIIDRGRPTEVFPKLIRRFIKQNDMYSIKAVYANEDYEPYARKRDEEVKKQLQRDNIKFHLFTDQVIFRPGEILKNDGKPYTVFTPFKNKWLATHKSIIVNDSIDLDYLIAKKKLFRDKSFPSKKELGVIPAKIKAPPFRWENIRNYDQLRDFPGKDGGSYAGVYLRFGVVSIRDLVNRALDENTIYLSELIWREFFMHVLWHFPKAATGNFKSSYDRIKWRNSSEEFQLWCQGKTGYPLVDAGLRELNQNGTMHNRVRMVAASFLSKHLLIDWRWGERYFSEKLFDYELASNVGNWQWCAGTGCDAAPYFRIFNPIEQARKFDPDHTYIRKWIPNFTIENYLSQVPPMVEHRFARERALKAYGAIKEKP